MRGRAAFCKEERLMKEAVEKLFKQYEEVFRRTLAGETCRISYADAAQYSSIWIQLIILAHKAGSCHAILQFDHR